MTAEDPQGSKPRTHRAVMVGIGACGARERTSPKDRFAIKAHGVTCPKCLAWIASKRAGAAANQLNERS